MKASEIVCICLGVFSLGTPQVLVLKTLILGIDFPTYGVPLPYIGIVIYNVVELQCFKFERKDITFNESLSDNISNVYRS